MIKKLIQRLLGGAAATPAAPATLPTTPPDTAAAAPAEAANRPGRAPRNARREGGAGQAPADASVRPAPVGAADEPLAAPGARLAIPLGRRTEVPVSEHRIDPRLLDDRAVRVVQTLQQAGFEAYIVGGAVRDLLVGRRPKDFDVATDATPEQVKAQFRRAFIIGRRFRIVHVIHGRGREHEVIEVSTFRAYLDNSEATQVAGNEKSSKAALAGTAHAVDASGRVLRDNVWGPQIEDAARRDFTINAMYYDPATQTVVDYHGGLADIRAGRLALIGDPATRYREDPVRIIRAMRFSAKLGFEIEPRSAAPIAELAPLLANVPASRLFDEMVKLLQTGHALASIEVLKRHGLHRGVFPILDAVFDEARATEAQQRFIRLALEDTDRRVADGRSVAPSFLLACLLWTEVADRWRALQAAGEPVVPALQQAVDAVFDARIGDISGRGKLGADMREIWMMQPRFERRVGNGVWSLIEQPRFRAGYDFLRLRADAHESPPELAEWWEDFSMGSDDDREAMLATLRDAQRPAGKGAKGRRRGGEAGAGSAAEAGGEAAASSDGRDLGGRADVPGDDGDGDRDGGRDIDQDGDPDGDRDGAGDEPADGAPAEGTAAPARKRRRRRRKPAGAGAAAGAPETAPAAD